VLLETARSSPANLRADLLKRHDGFCASSLPYDQGDLALDIRYVTAHGRRHYAIVRRRLGNDCP
jgi:hypothetical protein